MEVVAHEYCRQAMIALPSSKFWMRAYPKPTWDKREGLAEGGEPLRIVAPVTTVSERATYYYGNTEVQLITMAPAHTYGDITVYLPQQKILFAGDIAFHRIAPFLNNGHATSWISFVDKILGMNVDVIVPGHGPIGTKRDIEATREYLARLKAEARSRYNAGLTPGQACADINLDQFASWIGAEERMPLNIVRLYAEFAGTLSPANDFDGVQKATEEFNRIKSRK
jgi:glyoxylase-like metal-dependent hydrolase (beta-lactamase superfamily II)